ncbi:hypothetical protein H8356DRAFT_1408898 [Neocallimastix lanati (nom. inval.)]|nr:hypothetical protein H8356DRAFT_1408898 [Neocallimastix sp. JGI-2020a]
MKIEIYSEDIRHTDIVNSVGWIGNNELYSSGPEKALNGILDLNDQISKSISASLNNNANLKKKIYFTRIQWFPIKGKAGTEIYAIGLTDVEKVVEAHYGALLLMKWNYDGSAIATAGEDGQLKIWSRSGMLRSVLIQLSM